MLGACLVVDFKKFFPLSGFQPFAYRPLSAPFISMIFDKHSICEHDASNSLTTLVELENIAINDNLVDPSAPLHQ